MKRFALLFSAVGAVGAFALAGGASGASSLQTLNIAETGTSGITVSGSPVAGAANVVTTFTGKGQGAVGLVRLNPNESPSVAIAAGFGAVQSHHGDLNALTPTGDALVVAAGAPGTVQTVLTEGTWVALNLSGKGQPASAVFTVAPSSSPAPLPAAAATQTALEFAFRGPTTLHDGTIVREQNHGDLVHMIVLEGVRSKAAGQKLMGLLAAGAPRKAARPYLNGIFLFLLGDSSPGALQQEVLSTKPGYYVEACFEHVQDGRPHAQLGMERLVKVVK